MNPAYGRSVELARVAELRRDRAHAADNDADAHWVTIDHHHILVHLFVFVPVFEDYLGR